MTKLNILDLFCGLKGWSQPFLERGHNVVTLDIDPKFWPDVCADITKVDIEKLEAQINFGQFDLILASPPCEKFSVASIGKYWNHDHTPKHPAAAEAMIVLEKTVALIQQLNPRYWLLENPRGKMRRMEVMQQFKRWTVAYCQYGERMMKPTDLWGVMPEGFEFRPMCKRKSPCHDAAPRGARTGLQGIPSNDPLRSKIPYQLALAVCLEVERAKAGDVLTLSAA